MEAALLGLFMVSACTFGVLLDHPSSPVRVTVESAFARRVLGGIAMGLTAVALIYSPWGKQSGAHFNPAVTLTFLRLGKIKTPDALFYVIAQFAGGLAGVLLSRAALGRLLEDPAVNYVVTVPGPGGVAAAIMGEMLIAFLQMSVVLAAMNTRRFAPFTGMIAGAMVALYITFEAPLSGMSMNPARTLASALPANVYTALWIYFVVPPLAMLMAAQVRLTVLARGSATHCAKLVHAPERRCIFCGYRVTKGAITPTASGLPESGARCAADPTPDAT